MRRETERRLLQLVIAILCLSPLGFGLLGMSRGLGGFGGALAIGGAAGIGADSHFRYLSGIFFGVGIMAVSCIAGIERRTERFSWVILFVVIGGLARLAGLALVAVPDGAHFYAVFVELVLAPLIGLWQRWVARRYSGFA